MLHSQQASAPAPYSLKRINQQAPIRLESDLSAQNRADPSPYWPTPDHTDAGALANNDKTSATSPFHLDSTPKTVSQLFLDNLQGQSCADLLQLGFSSVDNELALLSGPPTASTTSGLDNHLFASSESACESSPAMSASSNYNFGAPSSLQISALNAPFSTSSPAVASVGTVEADSGKTSPSHHGGQGWSHQGMDSPDEIKFQAPYPHKNNASSSHHQGHHAHFNDHEYQNHGAHSAASQYFQHRASISGPLMDSAAYAERYESTPTAPAPPRVHGLAAWENASGSARPHTADGMFGHFGVGGPDAPSHESSAEGSVVGSSSRPYTPAGHGANVDPYYQHRRMSMPDPSGASANGAGKVFSYMAPGEEGGMLSSSSSGMSSHNYGSHYFGGGYNGSASKKRPRRRYDEIERLYPCSWLGCTKSYGTLNHLNAHVAMQKHGPKRSPSEFKDMRKAWRKQKKEEEQRRQSRQVSMNEQNLRSSFSGASYGGGGDMSSGGHGHHDLGGSASASVLPIGPPPALSGFGGQHAAATSLPGLGQLAGPMAHLSRYSMSSVSANPTAGAQSFYLNGPSAESGLHGATPNYHDHSHNHNATPLQYSGDNRLPSYNNNSSTNNNNAAAHHYNSIGAYISAHRGSV